MRASGWAGRLGLLLAGFLVAAVLLELALQAGAWWIGIRHTGPRGRSGWGSDGHHRVVCVGDSNTFGLDVDPEDTYPRSSSASGTSAWTGHPSRW
jgi:hypothetical protein